MKLGLFADILLILGFLGCGLDYIPPLVYTITYDPNGGSGSVPVDVSAYKKGETATVLEPKGLTKEPLVFWGWNTKPDGTGITYNPGTAITIDSELMLYACWIEPKSTRVFYVQRLTDNEWYELTAVQLAESEHCLVYADSKEHITVPVAEALAREYETKIYPVMTDGFGTIEYVDERGKVIFLLLDIIDGYTGSGSYVMGYFHQVNMYSKSAYPYSNEAAMLYLDINPLVPGSREFYAALAHELQHLINFSNTTAKDGRAQDIWIDEGLASAAEYLYGGDPNRRVEYYNADPYQSIVRGNTFFVWNGYWEDPAQAGIHYDPAANYATVYLFFQWLRIHSATDAGIYKEIINSSYRDYRAVTAAAARWIDPGLSDWETLLRSWMLANASNAPGGLYGYKQEISTVLHYAAQTQSQSWTFSPGEGIVSVLETGSFIPSSGSGTHIRYMGLSRNGEFVQTSPYTGDYLLTFNANTQYSGSREQGYLAGIGSAFKPAKTSVRNLIIPNQSLPGSYPIDVRFNIYEKSGFFD